MQIIELAQRVVDQGNSITIRWTPAHRWVEGNERADQRAKEVAPSLLSGLRFGTTASPSSDVGLLSGPSTCGGGILTGGTPAEGPFSYRRRHQDQASDPS